jgi:hypothetical protein
MKLFFLSALGTLIVACPIAGAQNTGLMSIAYAAGSKTTQNTTGDALVDQAISHIQKNELRQFERLVPSKVDPYASQHGKSLTAIAQECDRAEFVTYLANVKNGLTGYVIEAIEKNDLDFVKMYVPKSVSPHDQSSNGHTVIDIAKFHKRDRVKLP